MIREPEPEPYADNRGITADYREFLRSTKVGVRFGVRSGQATPKPLLHLQLRMEPAAGFEPATHALRKRNKQCATTV